MICSSGDRSLLISSANSAVAYRQWARISISWRLSRGISWWELIACSSAWTLRNGQTALDAAAAIHSDIARGFIRCEVIDWADLVASGSHAEAAKRALQRLEGKTYVVRDGDVLNIRFNV